MTTTTARQTTTAPELLVAYTSLLPAVIIPIRVAPPALLADPVDDDISLDITVDESDLSATTLDELEF